MPSEDVQTNLRMPADLKEALLAAAVRNNRSLSAEVVFRLVHSFSQDAGLLQAGEPEDMRREREALKLRHEVMLGRRSMLEAIIAFKEQMVSTLDSEKDMEAIKVLHDDLVGLRQELRGVRDEITGMQGRLLEIETDLKLPEWPEGLVDLANKMPR